MIKKKKKLTKKQIAENNSLILAILLSIVSIFAVALKNYCFSLGTIKITYAIFIIPIIIFISNYILNKYDSKITLQSILIASLIIITYIFLIKDLTNQKINLMETLGNFLSYFISLAINAYIYKYISINLKRNSVLIYFNYILTAIIYYLIYLIFLYKTIIGKELWSVFLISLVAAVIITIILVIFDSKVETCFKKKIR